MPWQGGSAKRFGKGFGVRAGLIASTALSSFCLSGIFLKSSAQAASRPLIETDSLGLPANDLVTLAALIGVVSFAVLAAISLIRSRNATEIENKRLRAETADLKAGLDRLETFLDVSGDRLISFENAGATPQVTGHMPPIPGVPDERSAFLAFGTWLVPQSAGELDRGIVRLRERGEPFALALVAQSGHFIEALGRTTGARAVVRFRELTGDRLTLAALEAEHHAVKAGLKALFSALDLAGTPAWLRDAEGRLSWVSEAYARAVDAPSAADAVAGQVELLDSAGREAVRAAAVGAQSFVRGLSLVAQGERHIFDVAETGSAEAGAGIAIDASAADQSRAALERATLFHSRTLDHLAAGVAVFGADRRLRSYNSAYRALFDLEIGYLDSQPEESELLDRLRARRRLPEQADYRGWKAEILATYRAMEACEFFWVLPDGQKLRVIGNPNPEGGVTWIYENVTERLELESRYNALARIQGETLDNLSEAVAVFGSDGRIRLNNPSFAHMWAIRRETLAERPHISEIVAAGRKLHDDPDLWRRLTACIAGVDETRASIAGRMERADGHVLDYATMPLPEGLTMVTFVDVTASFQVERVLTERNEALEAADQLKNAFIQHVSYELRSPLTNIIGFIQLLADDKIGPLNDKQREYVGYISSSSDALLAIVNDILDLATVDAGIMELELGEVDIARTVEAAVEGIRDRLNEIGLRLETHIPAGIGSFTADAKRVRQILYNLLSNAVRFSSSGGRVVLSVERRGGEVEFTVADEGAGMPESFITSAFERFESRAGGQARGGVGLGLSIVRSFVELHGGTVTIRSREGVGTTVTFRLPAQPQKTAEAAE